MKACKHEHWLYCPSNVGIGTEDQFLCADCGEWIHMGSIEIDKIVNVEKVERDKCRHQIKLYTMSSIYICLQCGFRWRPEPSLLNIETVSAFAEAEIKRQDRERRQRILDDYHTWRGSVGEVVAK